MMLRKVNNSISVMLAGLATTIAPSNVSADGLALTVEIRSLMFTCDIVGLQQNADSGTPRISKPHISSSGVFCKDVAFSSVSTASANLNTDKVLAALPITKPTHFTSS